ncbi:MAG TPA: vitamin K epoxide reductase family protein [Gemmatimonadaceae bacterium]|jgi:uncharacterized membrane protein
MSSSEAITRQRQAIVVLSALGMANATIVSLRQLDVIRHLPDPPLRSFHADLVTTSPQSFVFGIPDAPLALASLALNIPIALAGGHARAEEHPWLPLAGATKAMAEAGMAAWYFVQMPTRLNVWCAYCVLGAVVNVAIATLTVPEARRAVPHVRASPLASWQLPR